MIEEDDVLATHTRGMARAHDAVGGSAAEAMQHLTSLPVVDITIDGIHMLAAFEPDPNEHMRRSKVDVGAVTSTALLHGLWLLPSGVPVPVADIPGHKRKRLERAKHLVEVTKGCFERLYSPPGAVRAVGFRGTRTDRALRQAAGFTPIVQRLVIGDGPMRPSLDAMRTAEASGIGFVEHLGGITRVLLAPRAAELGVPAVYRWWIAELAYSSWLYESTQPVS
jgi:hypothetical protein